MEASKVIFILRLFGVNINITENIIIQWIIILMFIALSIILTRNLELVPSKKQSIVEVFVEYIGKIVKDNMGESYTNFIPFVGAMILFLASMNLVGLVGVVPPTSDISINLGMAMITFLVVQGYAIKKVGLINYITAYGKPYFFILPLNIIERFMLPISLSLRLFGNMTAAIIIVDLIYKGLYSINPLAQLLIPVPVHIYFDIFDGTIQMIIFIMLTMINIKIISEH
ncbi:F0F1 ATP synthase subunit A [uncultured Clostridium sp.]|uniref:F0F1 ATP synthase subunit A n=1 Tax=uncultured Clostridium sp. TaxID=59620 RepID=UPI0028E7D8DF|nr:F0F1 ATP synthase subunit A [uncultured Clostridium sp.]